MPGLRHIVHYGLHSLAPLVLAWILWPAGRWRAALVLLAANLIDLDHFFSDSVFVLNRCSIGSHPLHSDLAILILIGLSFWPRARQVACGIWLHLLADSIDCIWMIL
ncbi:MAG: hypothetical protein KDK39_14220 [Leptospiraceae bacterium]|nr:hypothetical protein [Leptospiraceae bacterium]